jgi:pyocin large subunit-like protein
MKPRHGWTVGALTALIVAVMVAMRAGHPASGPESGSGASPAPGVATAQRAAVQGSVPSAATAPSATPAPTHPEIGFHSRRHLAEHYEKHGREFGGVGMDEYLRLAQTLRDRPVGGDIVEFARADGAITRYDRASGAFISFDSDLQIRTFFKPNDGEAYFRRQALKEH